MVQNCFTLKSLRGQVFLINSACRLGPVVAAETAGLAGLMGISVVLRNSQVRCNHDSDGDPSPVALLDEFPGRNSNHSANVMFNSLEETAFQIIW